MINDIISEHTKRIQKAQDQFVRESIKKHCNIFQRLWFAVCLKTKWRVRFVEMIHQQLPMESYLEHGMLTFKVPIRFGVKINGTVHWMP